MLGTPQHAHEEEAGVRAHHEHLAVSEVDELQNSVHHRVTESHERDHRPLGEPREKCPRYRPQHATAPYPPETVEL